MVFKKDYKDIKLCKSLGTKPIAFQSFAFEEYVDIRLQIVFLKIKK